MTKFLLKFCLKIRLKIHEILVTKICGGNMSYAR